ncbi:MAG: hypothetical protein DWQ36_02360 [Acidobacteria bacterium]|nr:MAG: hypothetical protein DWQ30_23750 [Acidobacteriota bacterium]REK11286.1 MAG: hypothetical protein DWQ36_02360 [Acidobacteriota bacterium]
MRHTFRVAAKRLQPRASRIADPSHPNLWSPALATQTVRTSTEPTIRSSRRTRTWPPRPRRTPRPPPRTPSRPPTAPPTPCAAA